jgi:hypothetical protein
MDKPYKKYKLTPLYPIDFNFIFSDTKMNLHHPCTSCQNENCECMELQLQLQGNIYKPLEGLKLIAGISLMLIILITLNLLHIFVNIATQIKKCGLWISNMFKTIYKKYIKRH